jgi:hypothetical protein
MNMVRINAEEAKRYRKLPKDDPRTVSQAVAFTLTPIEDEPGWEEVTYYGEGMINPSNAISKPEYVYVLVNKSVPGICKIGMTTTSVAQRTKEINSATGVITPWYCVYSYKCLNSALLEKEVHKKLEDMGFRVNQKREGFSVDSDTAKLVIEQVAESIIIQGE